MGGGWPGGLVAVLLAGVLLFVNPNDYRDRIAEAVKAQTGGSLLPGAEVERLPVAGAAGGEARLGNPAGFGAQPFLTLTCPLRVKLLPLLLQRKLEAGPGDDGFARQLALKRNEAGKGNGEIAEVTRGEPGGLSRTAHRPSWNQPA